MNMPGFTAENSLYKSTRTYVAAPNHAAMRGDALVPALIVEYCKNPRPGWLIENTVCGDCANFDCYTVRGQPHCDQLSDWQPKCWNEEYGPI